MEFWGVEVKPGQPLKCDPGFDKYLHLSQASLGEAKKEKGNESIPIFVTVSGQKLVLGTLSPEKCTQITFDLVFEKEFELSHNWKNGSIYFCGYKTIIQDEVNDFSDTDSDSGEDIPLNLTENGKPAVKDEQLKPATVKANAAKPDSSAAKPVKKAEPIKAVEPKGDDDEEDEEDDESDEDSDEDESDDDVDMIEGRDGSSDDEDDDDSSDEEDEATPKKAELGKKRPSESAIKTPAPEKKSKVATPSGSKKSGTDGKKGGHTATPYPSKQAGKTPAATDKPKQQTPKSGGQVSCKSCSKTFNSDSAMQAHSKAKHSAGK